MERQDCRFVLSACWSWQRLLTLCQHLDEPSQDWIDGESIAGRPNTVLCKFVEADVPPSVSCPCTAYPSGERLRLMPRGLGCDSRFGAIVEAMISNIDQL